MKITLSPVAGAETAIVRFEKGQIAFNGKRIDTKDGAVALEYGEESGCVTFSDDQAVVFEIIPSKWVNPSPPPPPPPPDPIIGWRESISAIRWQMIVALGENRWNMVLAFRDLPDTTWAMQQILDEAQYIPRVSETVDLLAYILGMTDADADALFVNAMALRA